MDTQYDSGLELGTTILLRAPYSWTGESELYPRKREIKKNTNLEEPLQKDSVKCNEARDHTQAQFMELELEREATAC